MKVLIIEDESLAAEKLQKLITRIDTSIEVLGVIESVEQAVNWFSSNPTPDLVFMDIQLDDGISFEIFESIEVNAPIIFTTAYDQYAIKAFKVNSVDYLLKPIDKEALSSALKKYEKTHPVDALENDKINLLYNQLVKTYKTRFFVKIGTHYHSIPVNEIECVFVQERGVFIKTNDGKRFAIDYSLDKVSDFLDPTLFFRINRNYLVHIDSIEDILSYSTNRLRLKLKNTDNMDLIVSRERVNEFKLWMDR